MWVIMLKGLLGARFLSIAAGLLLVLGCTEQESGDLPSSTRSDENVASLEQGLAGAAGCTTDADCGAPCGNCLGNGTCNYANAGTICGSSSTSSCDDADSCDGAGTCLLNHKADLTACGSGSNSTCDKPDSCNNGVCDPRYEPIATTCGSSSVTSCSGADHCDGAGSCSDADFTAGTGCGDPTDNECTDPDTCDGNGNCQDHDANSGTACGSSADTECTNPDTCDGNGNCDPHDANTSTQCGDQSNTQCTDPDRCDGNGNCDPKNDTDGSSCGSSGTGVCDNADTCLSGVCVTNHVADGTTCGDQTSTTCNLPNTCQNGSCANNFLTLGTSCGSSLDDNCTDPDTCDGNGNCQLNNANSGTACGSGADTDCTNPDTCDGNGNCQANDAGSGTGCGSSQNTDCTDPDSCDGSGTCLPNNEVAGHACGSTTDNECTDPDSCDGNGNCAPNHAISGTACGSNVDAECNKPDSCDGSGQCATNLVANGTACDDNVSCTQNSQCDGSGACKSLTTAGDDDNCPHVIGDPLVACASWACKPSQCASSSECVDSVGCVPTYAPNTQVCRVAQAGGCDIAETCSGTESTCPGDAYQPSNTVCQSASCSNGVAKAQIACGVGNNGLCPTVADVDCEPYTCDSAQPQCRTDCVNSSHCQADYYCDAGTCKPRINPGQSCTDAAQCSASNQYCVDGVCCDTPCAGQCESCNQQGSAGTCMAQPAGSAPAGSREACAGDGTACDGTCNGTQRDTCVFPGAATECQAAACDPLTNLATEAANCDGAGACAVPAPVDCAPYACGATQCRGDCTADSDCDDSGYCRAGVCAPKQTDGEACSRAAQCASGFCADGVCCNARCDGQCEACNAAGNEGTCAAVTGAPVGSRTACSGSGDCAGTCDGSQRSACSYPGNSQSCRAASCDASVATLAAQCDGRGNCPAAQTVDCPAECEGTVCGGDECVVDSDCTGQDEYCAAGVCLPRQGPGSSCTDDSDCSSGYCTDGVCCDSACLGQCEACDVAGSLGTCSPVPSGEGPHGARPTCTSDGSACGGTCDGTNTSTCGYPVGTVCRDPSCSGADPDAVAVVEATCQGDGRCPAEQRQACGSGISCTSGGICNGDCAAGQACDTAEYCSAGVCVAKRPDGDACGGDDQCQSGFCTDGVCCASACGGQCEACDVPGSLGSCVAVSGSVRGGRAACEANGACGAECDGSNRNTCSFPGESETCGPAFCANGVHSDEQVCDGAGRCASPATETCTSYTCDGTECGTGCTTDADCTGENVCKDGVCEPNPLIDAKDEGTCGCRVPGGSGSGASWPALAVALGALLGLRRRRSIALR